MKNFSKKAICVFLAFILTVSSLVIYTALEAEFITVSGVFDYSFASQVLDLVNKERAKEGLGALVLDKNITAAAMIRSAECFVSFEHTRPNGDDCFTAFDYEYCGGENIAAGQTSPESVMHSWMNSPGHKANILKPEYTKIGIGCFFTPNDNHYFHYYWTQNFSGGRTTGGYRPEGSVNVSVDVSLTSGVQSVMGIAPQSISLNKNEITLNEGETALLKATITPADSSDLSVNWSSSDPSVADVYGGNVTAWNEGITTVTAQTSNGLTAECVVKVVKPIDEDETNPWELIPGETRPYDTIICGDVNGDGTVTAVDRIILTRFLAKWNGYEIDFTASDIDLDGKVTSKDRIILTRHLAKWSEYQTLPHT